MVPVAIALAILIAAIMPLLLIKRSASAAGILAMAYGALAILAVGYHTTDLGRVSLASTDIGGLKISRSAAPVECREMMDLLERGGVILDRGNPTRVIVEGRMWDQLPQRAQSVVETCIESERSPDDARGPVQFVNRES